MNFPECTVFDVGDFETMVRIDILYTRKDKRAHGSSGNDLLLPPLAPIQGGDYWKYLMVFTAIERFYNNTRNRIFWPFHSLLTYVCFCLDVKSLQWFYSGFSNFDLLLMCTWRRTNYIIYLFFFYDKNQKSQSSI